ncbi:MAG: hypothetical protein J4A00_00590 [Gammaproteobacteria bacterium]|nr:hypothetical protein [Gammaproteobacteria bacterium]
MPPFKGLARRVVETPARGVLWAVFGAVFALVPPLVFVAPFMTSLSGGWLALVALRRGSRVIAGMLLAGVLLLALVGGLSGSGTAFAVLYGLLIWAAPVAGALWLRQTAMLSSALLLLVGLAGVALGLSYAVMGDLGRVWLAQMEPVIRDLVTLEPGQQAQLSEALSRVSPVVPGLMAAGAAGTWVGSLLLARGWQAEQVNPGGFRREFGELVMPKWLMLPVGLAVALAVFGQGVSAQAAGNLALLGALGYGLQGLAIVHRTTASLKGSRYWLIALYVLMVMATLQTMVLLALVGVADGQLDFRKLKQGSAP